jgi:hypothetical protein
MWLVQFFPGWVFSLIFFVGIITFLVTKTVSFLPQAKLIQGFAIVLVFFGTYMTGATSNNDTWKKRTQELQLQISELETRAQTTNTKIVTKTLTKREIVREQGQEIVKYVDREIVKYDNTCVLPHEVVEAHNKAAK